MNPIIKHIVFILGGILAYFDPIMLPVQVVVVLFIADFITGIAASLKEGQSLKSSKARWSFVKMMVYLLALMLVFIVCERMGISRDTTTNIAKVVVWMIIYVEGLSVVENFSRIIPNNKVISFLHYMLSVEFLKYVPFIAGFLKEDKEKISDKENNSNNNEDDKGD